MHDETIPMNNGQQSTGGISEMDTLHEFIETSGDILSKPTALAEIIEVEGNKKVVVFCNSPSDADLVEVLLRRKGFRARKLIGHVSPQKVTKAVQEIKSGELRVLVVTDVAGQGLTIGDFDISINYSIHSDPEVYLQRSGQMGGETTVPQKVISLIGPLDITHFHYLKKIAGVAFVKRELPDQAEIATARLETLAAEATEKAPHADEKMKALASKILERKDAAEIVTLLLVNTYEVLPNISAAESQSSEDEEGPRGRRDHRGGDRDRDNGRGGRSGGRDRRDNRGDRDNRGSKWQGRGRDDEGGEYSGYHGRSGQPPKREVRIYLGDGKDSGVTLESFTTLLKDKCDLESDVIKRFSSRPNYSFVDVTEEAAPIVLEKLEGSTGPKGKSLFFKKAITLTAPREEIPQESEGEDMAPSSSEDTAQMGDEF